MWFCENRAGRSFVRLTNSESLPIWMGEFIRLMAQMAAICRLHSTSSHIVLPDHSRQIETTIAE